MKPAPFRLLAPLAAAAFLAGLCGHDGGSAVAQSGVAVRFHGRVTLAGDATTPSERQTPAPASRMLLQVVTAETADDVTVCAQTIISLDQSYEIAIPARWPCASRTVADPAPRLLFLVNGVQAAAHGRVIVNPNLSAPRTLGASYERDLDVPLGAVVPHAPVSTGGKLIRVRYWGSVSLAGRPAPEGTAVVVVTQRGGRTCGTGVVQDGLYVVDVPATPGQCTHRSPNDDTIFLAFMVNGERVLAHGRDIASPAYIGPASLAHAYRRDLEGRNPPPADVFAADGCDGASGGAARRRAAALYLAQERAAVTAQEPRTCIELPTILQFEDRFVRRRVEDCFRAYASARDAEMGLPIRDVLESLHGLGPGGTGDPIITFVEDPLLGVTLGETAPLSERDAAAVMEGRPASAKVRVLPALTTGLFAALAAVNESWQHEAGVFDYCANVLHELVHALDYVTGLKPPDFVCDFGNGLSLGAPEVKSITAENAYRISRGLPPRETYGSHRLPTSLVQPLPINWTRYQAHPQTWVELCR